MKRLAAAACVALQAVAPYAFASEVAPGAPLERLAGPAIELRRVLVEGPQLLSSEAIDRVANPYVGRMVRALELRTIADRLTDALEAAGYGGSRVRLPDQALAGGVVRFEVVAARLDSVEFTNLRWTREPALRAWVLPRGPEILHLPTLQERLALLRESGLVDRLDAELQPFETGGPLHALSVRVEEAFPIRVALSAANNRSPGVGALRREIAVSHRSLLGLGDLLDLRAGRTRGLDDSALSYRVPVPYTPLALHFARIRSASLAVDPPEFRALDITAVGDTDSAGLDWQLARSMPFSSSLRYSAERRTTRTQLLGFPFSFIAGVEGEGRVRVHRASLDAIWRSDSWSTAVRGQWSHGRTNAEEAIDGLSAARRFDVAGFAGSWVWQLGANRGQLHARLEGQHARDRLFPFEKLAVGGMGSVRGYRENARLFDSGAFGSIEWRSRDHRFFDERVALGYGAFVDAGAGRNARPLAGEQREVLASVGILLRAEVLRHLTFQVAYARPTDRDPGARRDAQDRGIHYAVAISYP